MGNDLQTNGAIIAGQQNIVMTSKVVNKNPSYSVAITN
jgi:hypothetical protein